MLSAIPEIEEKFEEQEFKRIIDKIKDEEGEEFLRRCYRPVDNGNGISYELDGDLEENERWRLTKIFCVADPDFFAKVFSDQLVAYYFSRYRERSERSADSVDDFSKAQYLNHLIEYFKQKQTRVIRCCEGGKMDELMATVYNIYDRAYFHKHDKKHSGCSDLDCFAEAERYYCREKGLDYFAYFEYKNRMENGLTGDEHSDYEAGKKKYDEWKEKNTCGCAGSF